MDLTELTTFITGIQEDVRNLTQQLTDRALVLELISSSDQLYQLDEKLQHLARAGTALSEHLDRVRMLARQMDAATDPALIPEVV